MIVLFFLLQLSAVAKTGMSFVYLNGSNMNDANINRWYKKGIRRVHPQLVEAFLQNPTAKQCLLKDGKYFIEETPVTFFWGDKNYNDKTVKNNYLSISKGCIPRLASQIRWTANNVLHDIIWIQNYNNMNFVLDNLHKTVMAQAQKGNKIVLYGYSSGSFVAYDYLLTRAPYINVADFFNSIKTSKEKKDFAAQHPMNNTCMAALLKDLAVYSADGHIVLNNGFDSFKKYYMNLNQKTCDVCIPNNSVIGMVNIASPLVLFHSDISDPDFELTYYNRLLYKYIFENDMFWLTVNYREDALSFPRGKNLTVEEIENITDLVIAPCNGFIYDQSNTRGGILAMTHLHYLSTRKTLAKSVVKAYVDGCSRNYGGSCEQKTNNKDKKTIDITP